MSILDRLLAHMPAEPPQVLDASPNAWRPAVPIAGLAPVREAVTFTQDLARVLSLPLRTPRDITPDSPEAEAMIGLMTDRLTRGPRVCRCRDLGRHFCIDRLNPVQAWALFEAPLSNGLLGPIGVGHGKTGLDIMMPMVFPDVKKAVLLVPPGLVRQLKADYYAWHEHFKVPSIIFPGGGGQMLPGRPTLRVVPYSVLSQHKSTTLLLDYEPDLIIADEAHKLRNVAKSATASRVMMYFNEMYKQGRLPKLCVWSGTLTSKSLKDYAHLALLSLRSGSPLPLDTSIVQEWAQAIDPSDYPAPVGELVRLCQNGEGIYEAFNRRLTHTKGVVSTRESSIKAELKIEEREIDLPDALEAIIGEVRDSWERPDGEELIDAMQVSAVLRQIACGFYYIWRYPRGEEKKLIDEWFAKRKAWHSELRDKLKPREPHLDSELNCTKAAMRFYAEKPYDGPLPVWEAHAWPEWREIRRKVQPEQGVVWLDEYVAEDAAEWAHKHRGVVWYEYDAFGAKVASLGKLTKHAGGLGAEDRILAERGNRSIVASIKAHGTGRDGLQFYFSRQLVANPPASGDAWEQLLGRLHRPKQEADEVETWVYRHSEEMRKAIDNAVLQARYIQGTMGTMQKLLVANVGFPLKEARVRE